MKKQSFFAVLLLAALLAGCAAQPPSAASTAPSPTAVPTQAPAATPVVSATPAETPAPSTAGSTAPARAPFGDFSTTGLDGKTYTQALFANAKLTMVNVWGTFCSPCIQEMPHLGELASEYKDKGFQIVGIVIDTVDQQFQPDKDQVALAKEIVSKTGAAYMHLIPSKDFAQRFSDVQYIPNTWFVDQNGGIIGDAVVGGQSKEDWKATIDKFLKESAVSVKKRLLPFLLLGVAVIFLALGVFRLETQTVLRKATTVCLECIGIG